MTLRDLIAELSEYSLDTEVEVQGSNEWTSEVEIIVCPNDVIRLMGP